MKNRHIINKGLLIPILFTLLLPPVCSLILGYEFSGQRVTHVPTAIVDHDNSTLSRNLTDKISLNDAFDIKYFGQENDVVKKLIESGEIATGIIIPKNFSSDMLNGQAPEILVIYDGTQMAMAGAVKTGISEVLGTIRSGYLLQVMQGKLNLTPAEAQNYIQPIAYTTRILGNPAKSTPTFILQGILVNIVQVAVFLLGIEMFDKKNKRFSAYFKKGIFCGLAGTLSAVGTLWIHINLFKSPFNGSAIPVLVLTVLNMTGMANIGILLSLLTKEKQLAVEFATLIMATLLLAGYTFPVVAMTDLFQKVSKFIPISYYVIPLRDVTLLGTTLQQVLPDIYWLLKFMLYTWLGILFACKFGELRSLISSFISTRRGKEAKEV
ncbi:Inner membrane transport permease YhhJ [Pelotomaculum schinkii]|uniref:Inner membrane transport permease YhhJ n=2 Tax=Pelotomaculum schinkii TaxID=78350 RepID=A0A4Y7RG11_9FIRM|nr:Inner membrane transport permease YhhJ [Pelotomaculum schinkii]